MIEFDNVAYTYDGTTNALDSVNLTIEDGRFVCILGGNGSGKSTLAKHMNALLVPDKGTVTVNGYDTSSPENTYVVRSNAGMVFQNPDDQLVATLVEDDVAFGPENLGVPLPELRERVTESLRLAGLPGFEKRETHALSGGQKQRVAIAGALAMHPRILILDEASAMLDPAGRAHLQEVCKDLNARGYTIVMITHFMDEAALADEVVVMQNGNVAASGTPEEVFSHPERIEHMNLDMPFAATLCRDLQKRGMPVRIHVKDDDAVEEIVCLFKRSYGTLTSMNENKATHRSATRMKAMMRARLAPEAQNGQPDLSTEKYDVAAVEVQHLSYTYDPLSKKQRRAIARQHAIDGMNATGYEKDDSETSPVEDVSWALRDVSFAIPAGEFVGIAGHTGSGKSTLLQMLNGLLTPTVGRVLVDGQDMSDTSNAAKMRGRVGLVFQHPEKQLFAATVAEDVAFGPKNMGIEDDEVDERVNRSLEIVGLDPKSFRDKNPFTLSGGEQRRVAFAGVLAMRPTTLMLDEPCAGLDPKNHQAFLDLIERLHRTLDITIVMVSHSMDDLADACDRVLVLDDGEIVDYDTPENVFEHGDALREIGLDQPEPQKMAETLRRAGVPIPTDRLYDTASLVDALADAYARSPRLESARSQSSNEGAS